MSLYRVLRPLSTGHEPGDIVDGKRFKAALAALVKARALAEVKPPPLSELPGWTTRAEKLADAGVVTAVDFLEADDGLLKEILNHKTTRSINKMRDELRGWLVVDEPKKKN
ncbi:MAG: hypothetical protein JSV86_06955 [Gemmatimonadota bacterium]|nr:MAG: hypothetical protein JSV86_06955 [Gemmatimonadota bacterium]